MSGVVIALRTPTHVVASTRHAMFVGFRGPLPEPSAIAYERAIGEFVRSQPAPRVLLQVAKTTAETARASDRMRRFYTGLVTRHRRDFAAAALVVAPSAGLGGALVRAMLAGLASMPVDGAKMRAFDRITPAVAWIDEELRARGVAGDAPLLEPILATLADAGLGDLAER